MIGLTRYALAGTFRSHRFVAPVLAFLVLLIGLYAQRPNPVGGSYAATTLGFVAAAAWLTVAVLRGEDDGQRQVTAVHAGGLGRARLGSLVSILVIEGGLAMVAVTWPIAVRAFGQDPTFGQFATASVGHLLAGLLGLALGGLFTPPLVTRAGPAVLGLVAALTFTAARNDSAGSPVVVRVLGRLVPPVLPMVKGVEGTGPLLTASLEAVAWSAAATAVAFWLARARS